MKHHFLAAAASALLLSAAAHAETVQVQTSWNHLVTFQMKMTGAAVAFPVYPLNNGLRCQAKAGNVAPIVVGGTSGVTVTADGTGAGAILAAGGYPVFLPVNGVLATGQAAQAWAIGTANDVLSCWGN